MRAGLRLFEEHRELGSVDAVLAAAALDTGAKALVSADRAFGVVPGLVHVDPTSPEMRTLLAD